MLVVVAGLQYVHLIAARRQTVETARTRAVNLASVLSEYLRGSFEALDTTLIQLAAYGARSGGSTAPASAWEPILAAAHASLHGSGSISVTDATGIIRHSTLPRIVGESRRDNYIFEHLSRTTADDLVVDKPYEGGEKVRQFIIPIGRRLTTRGGRFDGIVAATVLPERYRNFFKSVDVGQRGTIWVFHSAGVVLFREPWSSNSINESAVDNPVLQAALRSNGAGIVTGPLQAEGLPFISAYRSIGRPPVFVAVSLDEEEVLTDWRNQRQSSAIAFALLALALGGIVLIAFRQMDARARVETELGEIQRLEAERLQAANQRLEDALEREQQARRETETASYMKDEFLMTVSHELRTPLNAIYGWVRMLAGEDLSPDQRSRAVAAVERNARAQTRLIEDLLDMSSSITGKLRLEARPTDIEEVVVSAIETLRPAIEAKGIEFESEIDSALKPILADPDRLQQIVWNLLSNAIKFTDEGGRVTLRVTRLRAQVEIAVSDTGIGIAREFLPHVFERFRQGEAGTRRRYGGLGLGLSIVRTLVELHGGIVGVESAGEGHGSTFRVLLPGRTLRAGDASRAAALRIKRQPGARLDGVRVLVVDDEADARELFSSILGAAGAVVATACSSEEALTALTKDGTDVLLSDIGMPNEDGYQLLHRALSDPKIAAHPPIAIAVTAHARAVDRRRALGAGYQRHIAKPVEPSELVALLADLVHPHTLRS